VPNGICSRLFSIETLISRAALQRNFILLAKPHLSSVIVILKPDNRCAKPNQHDGKNEDDGVFNHYKTVFQSRNQITRRPTQFGAEDWPKDDDVMATRWLPTRDWACAEDRQPFREADVLAVTFQT